MSAPTPVTPSFARLRARALARAQPLSVHLEITYGCTWRCVFCYNPRHFDRLRLRAAEWEPVLDDLRQLGTLNVTLTGGDPMAHPEFFAIAGAVRRRHFVLRIFTNGAHVTEEAAARIAALQPSAVELSLHGATAAVHDSVTARAGSFDEFMAALRRLRQQDVPVLVKTPLCRLNEHQLDEIVALVESLGVEHRLDTTITPRDDGDRSPLRHAPSPEAVGRVLQLLRRKGRLPHVPDRPAGEPNCGVGRLTLAIDPEGNVFPCIQWRTRPLGNVRRTRLAELWAPSEVRRDATAAADAVPGMLMARGPLVSSFPYCPARAEQATGNALEPDPDFLLRARLADEILTLPGDLAG